MNLRCSYCKSRKPKTEDGKFISVSTEEWDSSFWLFCRDWCRIQLLGTKEEKANAVLPESQKSTLEYKGNNPRKSATRVKY